MRIKTPDNLYEFEPPKASASAGGHKPDLSLRLLSEMTDHESTLVEFHYFLNGDFSGSGKAMLKKHVANRLARLRDCKKVLLTSEVFIADR